MLERVKFYGFDMDYTLASKCRHKKRVREQGFLCKVRVAVTKDCNSTLTILHIAVLFSFKFYFLLRSQIIECLTLKGSLLSLII